MKPYGAKISRPDLPLFNTDLVSILGAGPAGASAAIAARREGAAVRLIEKSKFPRHKVCGEFLSPEIEAALKNLGAWDSFLAAGPARIHSMKLHFGNREKTSRLKEPAWGLSRYSFDALLFDRAIGQGARVDREWDGEPRPSLPVDAKSAIRSEIIDYSDLKRTSKGQAATPSSFFSSIDVMSV